MSEAISGNSSLRSALVGGIRVDATTYADASAQIIAWARAGESRYVCVATVNNVMQAHDHEYFHRIMDDADLVTADGMPLVWTLRLSGISGASRVYGPDLMRVLLASAERSGVPVALYGGTAIALDRLVKAINAGFPDLKIAYAWSPPFRELEPGEDEAITHKIEASGARLVFVGLSTPKQERWMIAHRGRIHAPMIGVGAAFDFLSGVKPQAPRWVMRSGLEWLFRLCTEPRRLWKRYLTQNPRFIGLILLQFLRCHR